MVAEGDGDRRPALLRKPGPNVLRPMFARLHVDAGRRAVILDLDPVGTHVHHPGIRVVGDDGAPGPDVPAAIQLVPERTREAQQVDVAGGRDVVEDRATADLCGRMPWRVRRPPGRAAPQRFDQALVIETGSEPERHAHKSRAGQARRQNPLACRMAGDLIEEQRARVLPPVVELAGRPDIQYCVSAKDVLQLTGPLRVRQPLAQVEDGHPAVRLPSGRRSSPA